MNEKSTWLASAAEIGSGVKSYYTMNSTSTVMPADQHDAWELGSRGYSCVLISPILLIRTKSANEWYIGRHQQSFVDFEPGAIADTHVPCLPELDPGVTDP